MTVRMKDVAAYAQVSPATVSKCMNNDLSISEATKKKVQDAIETLGYIPNMQARNFARKETQNIIFLANKDRHQAFTNPYLFEIMTGLESYLTDQGYTLSCRFINEKEEDVTGYIDKVFLQREADGIIIYGTVVTQELTKMLVNKSLPYIIVGKPPFQTPASWIDTNNYLSGQLCGQHLIQKGYSKIAFIGGQRMDNISRQRLHGLYSSLRDAGIKISRPYIKYGPPTKESGYQNASELLESADPPEVIIGTNNFVALGIQKAIVERSLNVPADINFVCFDRYPLAYIMEPEPVIIDIDTYDLGIQAGKHLLQRLRSGMALQIQTHSTLPSIIDN